jgi:hypothetical protein
MPNIFIVFSKARRKTCELENGVNWRIILKGIIKNISE